MLKNLKEFKLPEVEEEVLKFWKQHGIFEQSLKKNQGKKKFVFFEGPPTANGMPGIHHQLARSFKDVIPRFKAMQGFDVPRKGGWDTHGLPVELQAEKELGFAGKQDIEKYGIAEFNKKCKELVWRYREQFEYATDRLGFWLDLKDPYVTYDNRYIESLWWVIGQMDKRKLLYQGHKVVPWCTRCGTALSSHELAQGYREVEDTSVYVKFKVKKGQKIGKNFTADDKTYILSWTTTPWTLPGNVALAVHSNIEYTVLDFENGAMLNEEKQEADHYILSLGSVGRIFGNLHPTGRKMKGVDLVGLEYESLFNVKPLKSKKSYRVYPADFVTTTDGTGVVHTAVMYGEDDYLLGVANGLPQHHTVTEQGHFTKDVKGLEGLYAKGGKAEALIIDQLAQKGLLLKAEKYKHEYPHCWRCSTPLLYYARTSWFIAMSKLRKQLLAANASIFWTPSHIKDGRFGEWLKEVKDWNFSRERYWGTPLPVWRSRDGRAQMVAGSIADLKRHAVTNGNTFFGIRHGEAQHNIEQKNGGGRETAAFRSELTPRGIAAATAAAKKLKKQKFDLIVASPYYRIQQTAKILAKELKVKVVTDKRLGEFDCGIFNRQSMSRYHAWFKNQADRWTTAPDGAETLGDVRRRVVAVIRDLDKKYKNKKILIASHGDPLWILEGAMGGQTEQEFFAREFYPGYATVFSIDPPVLPLDEEGKLDVHRPYIDRVVLRDPKSRKELYRVKEVCDVWFDSGSMPYAQSHYPFDFAKGGARAGQKLDYPADYICEAIDQTRGWFYTLLAVATTLKLPAPYKNVICLGHIRDKNGQKMSKSKGNIVDPMMIMNKYGADVLRWYFFTANDPGDPKDFDEAELAKITRRFILIVYNSFVFWNSYGQAGDEVVAQASKNVLDRWVLARLGELTGEVSKALDRYEIGKAASLIETFTDDLSRWYIRRSRDRFQSNARGDSATEDDFREASATLRKALLTLSKVVAPFMPFFGEALYRSVGGAEVSVHLEDWPAAEVASEKSLLSEMAAVREAAAAGLALRAEAKIKVRQPLAKITLKNRTLAGKDELIKILLDEVNVKEVAFDPKLDAPSGVALDTMLTPALREEGVVRELTRAIQGLRADAKYQMSDEIVLMLAGDEGFSDLVQRYSVQLKKAVNAKVLELRKGDKVDAQLDTKVEDLPVWIGVRRL